MRAVSAAGASHHDPRTRRCVALALHPSLALFVSLQVNPTNLRHHTQTLLVVLGDLIQNGVTQSDMSMTGVTIAISTFVLVTVAFSYVSFKSGRARKVIERLDKWAVLEAGGKITSIKA